MVEVQIRTAERRPRQSEADNSDYRLVAAEGMLGPAAVCSQAPGAGMRPVGDR